MSKPIDNKISIIIEKNNESLNKVEKISSGEKEFTIKESILSRVNTPNDLKQLNLIQLEQLASEIRQLIIETVLNNGGHLASNLGVVELTIALHYVFNTPDDKIIWDVGHQTYAHKILTGRKEKFHSLRQYNGLSGFPKRDESEYDAFGTGHSSTSISAALGIAEALRLKGKKNKVIAVIGDGALMSGLAFEGLNHAGHLKEDFIVILNDNGMSIDRNVGAMAAYLSRIISGQAFNRFRLQIKAAVERIPGIGNSVKELLRKSEGFFKSLFVPGMLFQELGFLYIGPIPGHDLRLLIKNLRTISKIPGPIFLHVVTKKGKGYRPAEDDPIMYHGISPAPKDNNENSANNKLTSYTEVFGKTLTKIAEQNDKIVAITAGMTHGTGLEQYEKKFPNRFYDVGIAEPHAVTFAAGLATEGFHPVVAIYSTFLQRAYDQVIHDVCLQNLPVLFVLDRAGIVGEDGATHNGLFDLSYLRSMPNIVIMAPKDENELQHMIMTGISLNCPAVIRYPRGQAIGVQLDDDFKILPIGKAEIIKKGNDTAILAIGNTVYPALSAAEMLEKEGIECTVINSRFIKPLDKDLIFEISQQYENIFTLEENVAIGGFGSAICELVSTYKNRPKVHCINVPDEFLPHGSQKLLRKIYGLDATGIVNSIKKFLNR
jgi:1-deoxy-D-xylulose-5-phosphate synthase